jgi:hypothetical protein
MNVKRFIIAIIGVFIMYQVLNFFIHGPILGSKYMDFPDVWRADMMSKMWIMYITNLVMSILFVYIFIKGYEGKGIAEGIRFGFIIGLLMSGIGAFNQFVIYPVPLEFAIQWLLYGTLQFMICGIVTALIYKPLNS